MKIHKVMLKGEVCKLKTGLFIKNGYSVELFYNNIVIVNIDILLQGAKMGKESEYDRRNNRYKCRQ